MLKYYLYQFSKLQYLALKLINIKKYFFFNAKKIQSLFYALIYIKKCPSLNINVFVLSYSLLANEKCKQKTIYFFNELRNVN